MKKIFLVLFLALFIMTSTTVFAAERYPLGEGNVAVKLDYIKFTDSDLKDVDVDSGFYIGLEGYGLLTEDNLYLGIEAGCANPEGSVGSSDTELMYVPIEVNLKYAVAASQNVVFDIGAGLSYNYGKFEVAGDSLTDWMFGGQAFMDLNFTINQFFLGISGKYQIGEDFKKDNRQFSCNNWRIGGQLGFMF
jgi:hypothetical protein